MRQFSAIAASVANSTAFLFRTGSAPGSPRHTGQTFVFGGSPNRVEHEQKIFVAVSSWTCTSKPMTGSNFVPAVTAVSGVVAIERDYKAGLELRSLRLQGKRSLTIPSSPHYLPIRPTRTGNHPLTTRQGQLQPVQQMYAREYPVVSFGDNGPPPKRKTSRGPTTTHRINKHIDFH